MIEPSNDERELDFSLLSDDDVDAARRAARDAAIMLGERTVIALSNMLHDPKCSAQSRVAAGNGILRAGGFFDRTGGPEGGKSDAEMSPSEIRRELAALRQRTGVTASRSGSNQDDDPAADLDDIFG